MAMQTIEKLRICYGSLRLRLKPLNGAIQHMKPGDQVTFGGILGKIVTDSVDGRHKQHGNRHQARDIGGVVERARGHPAPFAGRDLFGPMLQRGAQLEVHGYRLQP